MKKINYSVIFESFDCLNRDRITDLIAWLKTLQKTLHNPPTFDRSPDDGGTDICITPGSMDGIGKVSIIWLSVRRVQLHDYVVLPSR